MSNLLQSLLQLHHFLTVIAVEIRIRHLLVNGGLLSLQFFDAGRQGF